jgi:phosphatidylserine/phosphatidylglycerophosphate/cardiolipin synthase-like enzyme
VNPAHQGDTDAVDVIARLAERLPADDLAALAAAALGGTDAVTDRKAHAASTAVRSACDDLLAILRGGADLAFVAGALRGAARATQRARQHSAIDIVWTGPGSNVTTSRLTSTVVIDLVDSARTDLLLVSYATRPPRELAAALARAVGRGVAVTVLLERHVDNPHFTGTPDPFPGLAIRRLAWPAEHRPAGAALHAKVMVVDESVTLIGSANLTGHALDRNIECGILLRGGTYPRRIRQHIAGLVDARIVVPI